MPLAFPSLPFLAASRCIPPGRFFFLSTIDRIASLMTHKRSLIQRLLLPLEKVADNFSPEPDFIDILHTRPLQSVQVIQLVVYLRTYHIRSG